MDGNETVTSAMMREALEEGGLTIKEDDLRVAHTMHRVNERGEERIDFFLTTKIWEGEPAICEPDKCDDLRWFSLDTLPENTIPYIRLAIEQSREGQTFSEFDERVQS